MTPTLPWVLPMYEKMKKHLVSMQNSDTQLPQICTAASAALAKLDKYYFKAVFNQYNIITTSVCYTSFFSTSADRSLQCFTHTLDCTGSNVLVIQTEQSVQRSFSKLFIKSTREKQVKLIH